MASQWLKRYSTPSGVKEVNGSCSSAACRPTEKEKLKQVMASRDVWHPFPSSCIQILHKLNWPTLILYSEYRIYSGDLFYSIDLETNPLIQHHMDRWTDRGQWHHGGCYMRCRSICVLRWSLLYGVSGLRDVWIGLINERGIEGIGNKHGRLCKQHGATHACIYAA